jgi:glycosyltransferase involved in cell wall biosynthesis
VKKSSHSPSTGVVLHIAWVRWWSALAYYAFSLAQGLDAIGSASRIVAPPGSPLASRAAGAGLLAAHWNDLASMRPDRFLRAVSRLRRGVAAGAISGVFAHTGIGHAAAALSLRGGPAPLLRVRADIRPPTRGFGQRWLYTRATDRVLVSGDFMRGTGLESLGLAPERILTLPAGFDLSTAAAIDSRRARHLLRAEQGWPADAPVVGMLARYSPVKGYRDFVSAACHIAERFESARFFAAGPPGQTGRARVAAWVEEAGLASRFALLDRVDDPLTVAAGFDVAVIASSGSEAVCRSALEYMALGLPIVATRVHSIPETVGEAGLLVAPEDPVALAGAITDLLADAQQRLRLADAARTRVREEFDHLKIARRAELVFTEVARERSIR